MIILWNLAFIIGFLPQIGWSDRNLSCIFFHYYSSSYLFFLAGCVFISIIICALYQVRVHRTVRLRNIRHRLSFVDETRQYHASVAEVTVILSRLDLLLNFVFYLPLIAYLMLHCDKCVLYEDTRKESRDVLYFYPLVLIKGVLGLFLHAVKTPQIYKALQDLSKCQLSRPPVSHCDSVRSTRTFQTTSSSIYSIARRYSMQLSSGGTLPKSTTSSGRTSHRRATLRDIDPRFPREQQQSSRSICTTCGHRFSLGSPAGDHRNSLSRSISAPTGGQTQSHVIYRPTQITPLTLESGSVNPVFEEPPSILPPPSDKYQPKELNTVTAVSDNSKDYRKSFVQTHMFKPQYLVCCNESNDPQLYQVPRLRPVPANYCPLHGVKFDEEKKGITTSSLKEDENQIETIGQIESPPDKPKGSLTTDL